MRRLLLFALVLAVAAATALVGSGLASARADPVMRTAAVALPRWPAGAAPIRVALLSDIHMESGSMSPERLARIVAAVNAARPDLVVIAGDFVDGQGHDRAPAAVRQMEPALARLHPRLGIVAVLGNHDYWTDPQPVVAMLHRLRAIVLRNDARAAGPLAIAGFDDQVSGHLKAWPVLKAWRQLQGAGVAVSHAPGAVQWLPPGVTLLLAGHTHCGQVVLPLVGAVRPVSAPDLQCGIVRRGAATVVITAGLGTSVLPFRIGAPPDWWLLTLGPAPRR